MRDLRLSERPVKRVLITFGGIDSANHTGFTIRTLSAHLLGMERVDVVVGEQHPFRETIERECFKFGYFFHQQTEQMAELMFAADLAIGACGFTCYELVAMQVPAILIPATKIQETVAVELSSKGLIYALIPGGGNMAQEMLTLTRNIMNTASLRLSISEACREFVDSDGTSRVVNELCH
jgi:UDP-2,4-diacetamido-2,4,6-trideoxy-beta-L-altropyranose hydrolase